ncbi:MAG: PilZ domain-containing protein [Hyphomicrobiaceae bacterium]
MQEKRAFPRYDVEIEGRLIFADGACVLDCVIIDISESGARIKTALDVVAPHRVYLWQAKTAMVFECEVRWQERKLIGLLFVDICGRQMRKSLIEACFPEHHKSRVERWLGHETPEN